MAKRYSEEIHRQALNRYFKGKQTAAQISREMNIPHQTVGAWITAAKRISAIHDAARQIYGAGKIAAKAPWRQTVVLEITHAI